MLRRRGYRFLTASELLPYAATGPPPRTATLTFDDGLLDGLTEAAPLLRSLGVRATFYVNPGRFGGRHDAIEGEAGKLLDAAQVSALHVFGMELGSHALTYADLRSLNDEELAHELSESKAALEEITGSPCRTLAYPYGLHDRRVEEAARNAGYALAFAWRRGRWRSLAAPRLPSPTSYGGRALALKMRGLRRPAWLQS
jgi:peptidoglycan/xylan/chitin deacetylase (PgdA/CDA1 family)